MVIKSITRTCFACPSQWEGMLSNNIPVYIRYRWGCLSIMIGKKSKNINRDIYSAVWGREIYSKKLGDTYDGIIEEDKVLAILQAIPEETGFQYFYRNIIDKIQRVRISRFFWYYFLGGKKELQERVDELSKQLNKKNK